MSGFGLALCFLALACGVMAGVYFTFSGFVMTSLATLGKVEGMLAMQSINRVILSSPFMPLFFGTTLASLGALVWGATRPGAPGSTLLIVGGLTYVVGMFVVTALGNVPLNDALEATPPASAEAAGVWAGYLRSWTFLNHLRTAACTVSTMLFAWAAHVIG